MKMTEIISRILFSNAEIIGKIEVRDIYDAASLNRVMRADSIFNVVEERGRETTFSLVDDIADAKINLLDIAIRLREIIEDPVCVSFILLQNLYEDIRDMRYRDLIDSLVIDTIMYYSNDKSPEDGVAYLTEVLAEYKGRIDDIEISDSNIREGLHKLLNGMSDSITRILEAYEEVKVEDDGLSLEHWLLECSSTK